MSNTITLVKQRTDTNEEKCSQCGFRSTTLWKFGHNEPDDLAACSSCTMSLLHSKAKSNTELKIQAE